MGIGAAIVGGAAIGAAGSIFSGILGGNAAGKQAEAIRYAAEQGKATALELNNRARADVAPFRQLGIKSGDLLDQIIAGNANLTDLFKESALYQFESEMGTRAIDRQLKARGAYNSGVGLETLALFDKSLAASEGNAWWDKLMDTTKMGANAASGMASNTTQTGNTVAQIGAQAGIAQGNALYNQGLQYGSIGQGIAGAAQQGLGQYVNYQLNQPINDAVALRLSQSGGRSAPEMDFNPAVFNAS